VTRKKEKAEYGDFQTPPGLAQAVCALLANHGEQPAALLEPTCGLGNFLFAGLDQFPGIQLTLGADVNTEHLKRARAVLQRRRDADRVRLTHANFFATDWKLVASGLPEPILVLGNPPWVTSAHLGLLGSQNLPGKSNFQKHNGLDAVTGKANFDISEWMLIRLFDAMNGRRGTLAMLCKSSTARKVLCHAWKNGIASEQSAIFGIDADLHFDAAVDAALLVTRFRPGAHEKMAKVYCGLAEKSVGRVIGYEDGTLLADVAAFRRWRHLCGQGTPKWRSGIKHDCAKVMELRWEGDRYRNGFGQLIELESTYVYPMLKSSGVAKGATGNQARVMLVTQKTVGEQTRLIEERAPMTWAYLQRHAELLKKRASSIYRKRPEFSIFGVGDYSFAHWKVAISGFYKKLEFVTVGPVGRKPVVLDDTSYFVPCDTEEQAVYLAQLLNSCAARSFYNAFVFWDSKRPITADLLRRLSLRRLAKELGSEEKFKALFGGLDDIGQRSASKERAPNGAQLELWPDKGASRTGTPQDSGIPN
jgi:hypothetical protein